MEIGQRGIKLFNRPRARDLHLRYHPRYPRGLRLSYGIAVHVIQKWLKPRRSAPRERRQRAAARTTIQQHHKSRRTNNKIPVAHTHHVFSACVTKHTRRVPRSVSLFLFPSLSISVPHRVHESLCSSSPPFSPRPSAFLFRNSFPFLNSRNRAAVHSRFAPGEGERKRDGDRKKEEPLAEVGRSGVRRGGRRGCVGHLIEKSDDTMGGRYVRQTEKRGDARDIPCAACLTRKRVVHTNGYTPPEDI